TDGEIEVKKLDISKAYNDVIEIKAQKDVGGTKVDLGTYTLTLKNDAKAGILSDVKATIDISKLKLNTEYGFEFNKTGKYSAIYEGATNHPGVLANSLKEIDVTKGSILYSMSRDVAKIRIKSLAGGVQNSSIPSLEVTNDTLLKEVGINIGGGYFFIKRTFNVDSTEALDYEIEFLKSDDTIIQKMDLKLINTKYTDLGESIAYVDRRLLLSGWTSLTGQYTLNPTSSWKTGKVDSEIVQNSINNLSTVQGKIIKYIYVNEESAPIQNGNIIKYPLAIGNQTDNGVYFYTNTLIENFFSEMAISKTSILESRIKIYIITSDEEGYTYTLKLNGGNKQNTIGEVGIDISSLDENDVFVIDKTDIGDLLDIDGALPRNLNNSIGTHLEYTIGTSGVTQEILINNKIVGEGYEIYLNSNKQLEIKKLDRTKEISDIIVLKSLRKVGGDSKVLGEFTINLNNIVNKIEIDGSGVLNFGNLVYQLNSSHIGAEEVFKVKNPENLPIRFSVKNTNVEVPHVDNNITNTLKIEKIEIQKLDDFNFKLKGFAEVSETTDKGQYRSRAAVGEIEVMVDIN
ncbi:MAG: hypothetical protein ACRC3I_00085, partial [Cetobacterium sp.]